MEFYSPLLKQSLHLVQHIIHQPSRLRLRPGEPQYPAGPGPLAPYGQALSQVQHAAGAGGGFGGFGVGQRGGQGFGEDGDQGGPLGFQPLAPEGGEGVVDQLLDPAAQGGGEAFHAGDAEAFGRGEAAVQRLDHGRIGAQAGAGLTGERGVEGGDGGVERVEMPLVDEAQRRRPFSHGVIWARISFSVTMAAMAWGMVSGVRRKAGMVAKAGSRRARSAQAVRRRRPEISP